MKLRNLQRHLNNLTEEELDQQAMFMDQKTKQVTMVLGIDYAKSAGCPDYDDIVLLGQPEELRPHYRPVSVKREGRRKS